MPRDGANIYSRPPGTNGVTDTTIESTKYNAFVADVEQDLNLPRPIVAGGTGANNADAALVNLSAEKAKQIVTNYDSFAFVSGSFLSAAATASPVAGHTFIGTAIAIGSTDMWIEATDLSDANLYAYTRFKQGGVWGAWKRLGTGSGGGIGISDPTIDMFAGLRAGSARFVVNTKADQSGADALTVLKSGEIYIKSDANNAYQYLQKTGAGMASITGLSGPTSLTRWSLRLGDTVAEGGGNSGSNFALYGFNDLADTVTTSFTINRASGAAAFNGALSALSGTFTNALQSSGNLTIGGLISSTGQIITNGTVRAGAAGAGATYYFGNASNNLSFDGTNFTLSTGPLQLYDRLQLNGVASNTPIIVTTNNGFHNKYYATVTGTRAWSWGVYSTGVWTLIDESAGLSRLDVLTNGVVVVYQGMAINAGGLGVYGGIVVQSGGITISDGAISVNKTGSTAQIAINNNVDDSRLLFQLNGANKWQQVSSANSFYIYNGNLTAGVYLAGQAATSWSAISDERLKENVQSLSVLDMLSSFRAVRYTLTTTGETELGIIAQEQVEQWPELIHRGSDGELTRHDKDADDSEKLQAAQELWSATYDRFGVIALQGVKELLARVVGLETELAALKAKA